jgi:hypothetical protein
MPYLDIVLDLSLLLRCLSGCLPDTQAKISRGSILRGRRDKLRLLEKTMSIILFVTPIDNL